MTEGHDRLALYNLYNKIMEGDDNQIETPRPEKLASFVREIEKKVEEFRRGNTPEE